MTKRSEAVADLDTRLAEFDRRLRAIQADLVPDGDPAPAMPARGGRSGPLAELLEHEHEQHERLTGERSAGRPGPAASLAELRPLLSSLHEVLDGIEALLSGASTTQRETTIAAGPFETIEQVRAFERRLAGLRGVREVSVRGYEGAARAIIDVQLGDDH